MNNNLINDLNLEKFNIKDLTLLLKILNEINSTKDEEIEVI